MVAADQKYIQTFVEPKVHKIREVLNITQMPEKREVLEALNKPLTPITNTRIREYPLNPIKYVNQPIIEPIIEKSTLKINFIDDKDNIIENEA